MWGPACLATRDAKDYIGILKYANCLIVASGTAATAPIDEEHELRPESSYIATNLDLAAPRVG
jgi:hypothetical protein